MTHPPDFIPDPNPNALQVFSVVEIGRIDDTLDPAYWWIEARTACGRSIVAVGAECAGRYEVVVAIGEGRAYRSERHYTGENGSDAERVFENLRGLLRAAQLRESEHFLPA